MSSIGAADGIDDLERMRPKRDEHGAAGRARRARSRRRAQNVAMAEVHAVERADGDDRSAGELRQRRRRQPSRSTSVGRSCVAVALGDGDERFLVIDERDARAPSIARGDRHCRATRVRARPRRAGGPEIDGIASRSGCSVERAGADVVERHRVARRRNGPLRMRRSAARCAALPVRRPRSRASARMYVPPPQVIAHAKIVAVATEDRPLVNGHTAPARARAASPRRAAS